MDAANRELSASFFDAVTAGDLAAVRALCRDDVVLAQNGTVTTLSGLLGFITAVRKVAPDMHYENAIRVATENGFVEEHDFRGTFADGAMVCIRAVVVATVVGGKIASMHEYADTAAAAPLLKALGQ